MVAFPGEWGQTPSAHRACWGNWGTAESGNRWHGKTPKRPQLTCSPRPPLTMSPCATSTRLLNPPGLDRPFQEEDSPNIPKILPNAPLVPPEAVPSIPSPHSVAVSPCHLPATPGCDNATALVAFLGCPSSTCREHTWRSCQNWGRKDGTERGRCWAEPFVLGTQTTRKNPQFSSFFFSFR